MFRPSRYLRVLGTAALFGAAALAACHDTTVPVVLRPAQPMGRLALYADLTLTPVTALVVQVSGPGILKSDGTTPDTLAFNLPMSNGTATGTIEVPAGPSRTIMVHAYSDVVETHRGSIVTNVAEGTNPTVSITLVPLVGNLPITVSIGSQIVIVRPGVGTLQVGDTVRLRATVYTQNGDSVVGAPVRWATLNPVRATVDTSGLVMMRDTGDVQIVAAYGTVGGSAHLTGVGRVSDVPYYLTWSGGISRAWGDSNNWTPHGIGVARVPALTDSVVIPAGPANQPQLGCGDRAVKDLTIEVGASVTNNCGYGINVYGGTDVRGSITTNVYMRPGSRLSGNFTNVYVYGDSVRLADSVRAAYFEVNAVGANLLLGGHRLTVTGDLNVYNGTLSVSDPDTLALYGNVNWSGGDHTGLITGGVVRYFGPNFYGYRYKASGTNRLVFERTATGRQQISGFDYIYNPGRASLQKWAIRNAEGATVCGHVSVADSVTVTSIGTPSLVDNAGCGGYYVRAYGPVITGAGTQVSSYLWEIHDTTGTTLVNGTWSPYRTDFDAPYAQIKPNLTYVAVRIYAPNRVLGPMTLADHLWIEGPGTELDLNSNKVQVGSYLHTDNGGLLSMTHAADTLLVASYAEFVNSNTRVAEAAKLTAGLLRAGLWFNGTGFDATGTHTVELTGATGTDHYITGINYESVDQGFQNLTIDSAATYGLCTRVKVRGTMVVRAGATVQDWCGNPYLMVNGSLTTEPGSVVRPYLVALTNPDGTSNVNGTWQPAYTDFDAANVAIKPGLSYVNMRFYNAPNQLLGATNASGTVWLDGGSVDLSLNGHSFGIAGNLLVNNSSTLTMTNAADSLEVAGHAEFNSNTNAVEATKLTAGVMRVGGHLYGYGFSATGTHRVVMTHLTGAPLDYYISGMNYESRGGQAFQNLEFAAGTTVGMCERIAVNGALVVRANAIVQDWCGNPALLTRGTFTAEAGSDIHPYYFVLEGSDGTMNVNGVFHPTWTNITNGAAGNMLKSGLGYTNIGLYAAMTLNDSLVVNGSLTLSNVAAVLTLNGHRVHVLGDFNMDASSSVVMTNPADTMEVNGNEWWDPGPTMAGKLTAGTVIAHGNTFYGYNYAASGTHTTIFDRTAGPVFVQGLSGNTSQLNNMIVRNVGVRMDCHVDVVGNVSVEAGSRLDGNCSGSTLTVNGTLSAAPGSMITNGPSYPSSQWISVFLNDSAGTRFVNGAYDANATYFIALHSYIKPDLQYRYMRIDRSTSFLGNTLINGQLDIINDALVDLAGHTVEVRGVMNFDNTATLRMTNPLDTLLVATGDPAADFYWDGGDNGIGPDLAPLLSNGVIKYYGDRFVGTQYKAQAGSPHRFVFASNQSGTVSVEGNGSLPTPQFANMQIAGTRTVGIYNRAKVQDTLDIAVPALLTGNDYIWVQGVLKTVAGSDIQLPSAYLDNTNGTRDVLGRFRPTSTFFRAAGAAADAIKPLLEYTNVEIDNVYQLADSMSIAGQLNIVGTNANLVLNGRRIRTAGPVDMWSGGGLTMTQATDSIVAGGYFRIQGGAGSFPLSAGTIVVNGDFFENGRDNVLASGAHKLVMAGTAGSTTQQIYVYPNGLRTLANVDITGTRPVNFYYGGTVVNGALDVISPTTVSASSLSIAGKLSSAVGSSITFTGTTTLGDATGTSAILGTFANNSVTRFNAAGSSIRSGTGMSYANIEIASSAAVLDNVPLALGGSLTLTSASSSLTVPARSTIAGDVVIPSAATSAWLTVGDSTTIGGSMNVYGRVDFSGSAKITFDLTAQFGSIVKANGTGSTQFVDFRDMWNNTGGTVDNSVAGAGGGGFRVVDDGVGGTVAHYHANGGTLVNGVYPVEHP